MGRLERKLLRIVDELARLRDELRRVEEELTMHRHIDDDARRDAAVSDDWMDRSFARMTEGDVRRFERARADLIARISALEDRRRRLLERLDR